MRRIRVRGGIAKTYNFRQVDAVTDCLEQTLCNNESPGKRLPRLLLDDPLQHPLQILHIVMLIPPDGAAANLLPLPDRIVARLVSNNDVASLSESRDHGGHS